MAKTKTIYAQDEDGTLYIRLDVIMDPWVAGYDGISFYLFDKVAYLTVERAIEWLDKEAEPLLRGKPTDRGLELQDASETLRGVLAEHEEKKRKEKEGAA